MAVAPAFSGVALLAVLVVSALVGAMLLAAPYPPKGAIARPVWDPPSGVPDLFAWLMASWLGRILIYLLWVWCGWHFLAR